jgi:hypothetical protein
MPEIGLGKFATIARHVGQASLPASRSQFSNHRFQQPPLLAILCLMRDEEWTFREAEVRLAEHAELRTALGLRDVPDDTTVYRCLRRLDEAVLEQIVSAIVQRLVPPPQALTDLRRMGRNAQHWQCPRPPCPGRRDHQRQDDPAQPAGGHRALLV